MVAHEHFRLFLTTMPFDGFPASIIRQSTKISAEAPIGVKNNFIRLMKGMNEEDFNLRYQAEIDKLKDHEAENCEQLQKTYHRYLWNLALYFSTVLERRRFGPIGFSTNYDWADPDFNISRMQLKTMLGDLISSDSGLVTEKIASTIGALRFLISEINVGGRVSDNKDILIVSSMMDAYY